MSDMLKFLGAEPAAEPEVMPPPTEASRPETPAPPAPPPETAPISALLDERDKRKAAQAEAQALQRQMDEWRARAQPTEPLHPEEAVQQALYNQNLRACRRFAEREYGRDAVAQVHDWAARRCDLDPAFNQQMRNAEDPYEAAVQAYNREQVLATVKPGDLAAFKSWQAAQFGHSRAGPAGAPSYPPPAARVPRSLANAPGNGGAGQPHIPIGPGQAFASTLNR